jgi:hypothetical protein
MLDHGYIRHDDKAASRLPPKGRDGRLDLSVAMMPATHTSDDREAALTRARAAGRALAEAAGGMDPRLVAMLPRRDERRIEYEAALVTKQQADADLATVEARSRSTRDAGSRIGPP